MLAEYGDQVGQEDVRAGHLAAGQRQLEDQLGQPVRRGDVGQRAVPGQRAERRGECRQQAFGQLLGGQRRRRQPSQCRLTGAAQLGGQVARLGVDRLEHGMHRDTELGAGGQARPSVRLRSRSGGGSRAVRRTRPAPRRSSSSLAGLGLAGHSGDGRLDAVGGRGQTGVGGPPPLGVEQPVEAAGRQSAGRCRSRGGCQSAGVRSTTVSMATWDPSSAGAERVIAAPRTPAPGPAPRHPRPVGRAGAAAPTLAVLYEGAHQVTTWHWARVSADVEQPQVLPGILGLGPVPPVAPSRTASAADVEHAPRLAVGPARSCSRRIAPRRRP